MTQESKLTALSRTLAEFAREREWEKFHSPKNLATALAVEAAELLEHFQWLTEEESRTLDAWRISRIADEIADVQIYLVMLAGKLGIDPLEAALAKVEKNRLKYPVERARGSAARPADGE